MFHIEQIQLPQSPLFLLQNTHKLFFKTQQPMLSLFVLHTWILFSHKQVTMHYRVRAGANLTLWYSVRQKPESHKKKRIYWLLRQTPIQLFYLSPHNPMEIQTRHFQLTLLALTKVWTSGFQNKTLMPTCPMARRKANEATETCQF